MNKRCGCCKGTEPVTPEPTANRPGLATLAYRVGTHAGFLQTMQARLASADYPELAGLTTRDAADPAIALLDAWACVGDVLSFYQERIANEGYLRTAGEERSVRELARLVGYRLRPGVAGSVYLAFNLEDGAKTTIPAGTRAQSLPGPGELPQPFETAEKLEARAAWNALKPRMTRPQKITAKADAEKISTLYFKGTATNLNPNDMLLIVLGNPDEKVTRRVAQVEPQPAENRTKVPRRVAQVDPQPAENRTKVTLQQESGMEVEVIAGIYTGFMKFIQAYLAGTQPLVVPMLELASTFVEPADSTYRMVNTLHALPETTYQLLRNIQVQPPQVKVHAFRVTASLFGHNCPGSITGPFAPERTLWLDNAYEQIMTGGYVIVRNPAGVLQQYQVESAVTRSAQISYTTAPKSASILFSTAPSSAKPSAAFSGKTTVITLSDGNVSFNTDESIRSTIVYAQSEELPLADEPITDHVAKNAIELADLYDGLEPGRLLIVSGERLIDIEDKQGNKSSTSVAASELVTLAGVNHSSPGDAPPYSTLLLAGDGLAHTYKRDTVTIYANVVQATHGETRSEVLGSGDATQVFQSFPLRFKPLTYLSAATASGAASTLELRADGVRWREAAHLAGPGPTDRVYITSAADDGTTTLTFGDGRAGARLPSGSENIRATYRSGIGSAGNVAAGAISQLATRPLGVKGVTNPLNASGGADPETRDQARANAPLAVMALDRLVSVQDYADFARTFAGIGKARAARLTDGRRTVIHLTIGAPDPSPISKDSALYTNLIQALRRYGDPAQPFQVDPCERMLLLIKAGVRLQEGFEWDLVEPQIRAALQKTFGYAQRELGQDVALSEVISTIQGVTGVEYVDVDVLGGVPSKDEDGEPLDPAAIAQKVKDLSSSDSEPEPRISVARAAAQKRSPSSTQPAPIRPAQIAYLTPQIPETLMLEQIQ